MLGCVRCFGIFRCFSIHAQGSADTGLVSDAGSRQVPRSEIASSNAPSASPAAVRPLGQSEPGWALNNSHDVNDNDAGISGTSEVLRQATVLPALPTRVAPPHSDQTAQRPPDDKQQQAQAQRGNARCDTDQLDPRIRIPFREITLHKVIGKGSFKTVYRGSWNNTHVAVVAMRRGGLVAEARLLQRLSIHPNLVQLYRWSADSLGNEYLVMELLQLGSLDAVLRSIGRQLLTQTKMTIVEQLVSACLELSREGLVHGDLAARNLLVKSLEPPHIKLADFGLSRPAMPHVAVSEIPTSVPGRVHCAPSTDGTASTARFRGAADVGGADKEHSGGGTQSRGGPLQDAVAWQALPPPLQSLPQHPPQQSRSSQRSYVNNGDIVPARWAALEVLAGGSLNEAADVWSFGVTCWEIFANGAEPYASLSNAEVLVALRSRYRLARPRGCPLELWELILQCWAEDPTARPTFAMITETLRGWREAYLQRRTTALDTATCGIGCGDFGIGGGGGAVAITAYTPASLALRASVAGDVGGSGGAVTGARVMRPPQPVGSYGDVGRGRASLVLGRSSPPVVVGPHSAAVRGSGSGGYGIVTAFVGSTQSSRLAAAAGPAVAASGMSTHLSFDIAEPPITPAYTSGSSFGAVSQEHFQMQAQQPQQVLQQPAQQQLPATTMVSRAVQGAPTDPQYDLSQRFTCATIPGDTATLSATPGAALTAHGTLNQQAVGTGSVPLDVGGSFVLGLASPSLAAAARDATPPVPVMNASLATATLATPMAMAVAATVRALASSSQSSGLPSSSGNTRTSAGPRSSTETISLLDARMEKLHRLRETCSTAGEVAPQPQLEAVVDDGAAAMPPTISTFAAADHDAVTVASVEATPGGRLRTGTMGQGGVEPHQILRVSMSSGFAPSTITGASMFEESVVLGAGSVPSVGDGSGSGSQPVHQSLASSGPVPPCGPGSPSTGSMAVGGAVAAGEAEGTMRRVAHTASGAWQSGPHLSMSPYIRIGDLTALQPLPSTGGLPVWRPPPALPFAAEPKSRATQVAQVTQASRYCADVTAAATIAAATDLALRAAGLAIPAAPVATSTMTDNVDSPFLWLPPVVPPVSRMWPALPLTSPVPPAAFPDDLSLRAMIKVTTSAAQQSMTVGAGGDAPSSSSPPEPLSTTSAATVSLTLPVELGMVHTMPSSDDFIAFQRKSCSVTNVTRQHGSAVDGGAGTPHAGTLTTSTSDPGQSGRMLSDVFQGSGVVPKAGCEPTVRMDEHSKSGSISGGVGTPPASCTQATCGVFSPILVPNPDAMRKGAGIDRATAPQQKDQAHLQQQQQERQQQAQLRLAMLIGSQRVRRDSRASRVYGSPRCGRAAADRSSVRAASASVSVDSSRGVAMPSRLFCTAPAFWMPSPGEHRTTEHDAPPLFSTRNSPQSVPTAESLHSTWSVRFGWPEAVTGLTPPPEHSMETGGTSGYRSVASTAASLGSTLDSAVGTQVPLWAEAVAGITAAIALPSGSLNAVKVATVAATDGAAADGDSTAAGAPTAVGSVAECSGGEASANSLVQYSEPPVPGCRLTAMPSAGASLSSNRLPSGRTVSSGLQRSLMMQADHNNMFATTATTIATSPIAVEAVCPVGPMAASRQDGVGTGAKAAGHALAAVSDMLPSRLVMHVLRRLPESASGGMLGVPLTRFDGNEPGPLPHRQPPVRGYFYDLTALDCTEGLFYGPSAASTNCDGPVVMESRATTSSMGTTAPAHPLGLQKPILMPLVTWAARAEPATSCPGGSSTPPPRGSAAGLGRQPQPIRCSGAAGYSSARESTSASMDAQPGLSLLLRSSPDEVVAERQAIFGFLQTRQLEALQRERDW